MKTTLLFVSILALAGCGEPQSPERSPDSFINLSVPPVTLFASDPKTGDIILKDGTGHLETFHGGFYAARAIASSKKPGEVLKP